MIKMEKEHYDKYGGGPDMDATKKGTTTYTQRMFQLNTHPETNLFKKGN